MAVVDFSLKDKVAVISGASRGIGESVARAYAEHGASVVLCARKQEGLDPVAESIKKDGGKAMAIACHTGKPEMIEALFEETKSEFGRVDILVNNAATNPYFGPFTGLTEAAFDKTIEVNIKGYFLMSQHAAKIMEEQNGGAIINVASIAGLGSAPMQGIYGVTKAAVISMTRTMAVELAHANIRVNAIAPGLVETKFAQVLIDTPEIYERIKEKIPMKRHGQPNEIAGAAVYLASEAASFVTGETLVVDGGSIA